MKPVFFLSCAMLFAMLHTSSVLAIDIQEDRNKAARYYEENNFKKAYKVYFKLAKVGDHYSQNKLSQMYVDGKGKNVDLTEAYAWSVLAAESGVEGIANKSEKLLQQTANQTEAQKRAEKLKNKYGKDALQAKASRMEQKRNNRKSGSCTGSSLGCS